MQSIEMVLDLAKSCLAMLQTSLRASLAGVMGCDYGHPALEAVRRAGLMSSGEARELGGWRVGDVKRLCSDAENEGGQVVMVDRWTGGGLLPSPSLLVLGGSGGAAVSGDRRRVRSDPGGLERKQILLQSHGASTRAPSTCPLYCGSRRLEQLQIRVAKEHRPPTARHTHPAP